MDTRKLLLVGAFAAAAATATAQPAQTPADLIARARTVAGEDLRPQYLKLCEPSPASIAIMKDKSKGAIEPIKAFDNLYYVGKFGVSATVLRTSAGLILIDTMSNDDEAANILVPGLRKLGLDPRDIRYVVTTHAHGDHVGGIKYLRANFPGFKVIMPDADWAAATTGPLRTPTDMGYADSTTLTLGDTKVTLVRTPGHTPGTQSLLYPVQWQGKTYTVMQWGGGQPHDAAFTPAAIEPFLGQAKAARASIRWTNHTKPDIRAQLEALRSGSAPHPFIYGEERFARYLDIITLCKRAGVDAG